MGWDLERKRSPGLGVILGCLECYEGIPPEVNVNINSHLFCL